MNIKSICVYCGSSPGADPDFAKQADALGRLLAEKGLALVYGGARVGLMGAMANAALAAGGKVTGVMPDFLVRKEIAYQDLTELRVVNSMHERKTIMAELADAFIALPGGFGTLEELFEVLTWAQLGLHSKPCGLLNINGYFNHMISFLDHSVSQGFVAEQHRSMIYIEDNASALLTLFENHVPTQVEKWLGQDKI